MDREDAISVRGVLFLPLAALVLTFCATTGVLFYFDKAGIQDVASSTIRKDIEQQVRMLAQEVYLFQEKAIKLRLEALARHGTEYIPGASVCLNFESDYAKEFYRKAISNCPRVSYIENDGPFLVRGFVPIVFGSTSLGVLNYSLRTDFSLADVFPPKLLLALGLSILVTLGFGAALSRRLQRTIVLPLLSEIERKSRDSAIARTTQMLAHDVRKPFSMIGIILNNLQDAKTFAESQEIVAYAGAEVRGALTSVTGMLQDVMEIGSDPKVSAESTAASTLIDAALREVCRVYQDSDVTF